MTDYVVDALARWRPGPTWPSPPCGGGPARRVRPGRRRHAVLRNGLLAVASGATHQRHGVPDVVDIGFTWLAGPAQRTHVNTEAKLLMMTHAFEVWEVHRVALQTDVRNKRSLGRH